MSSVVNRLHVVAPVGASVNIQQERNDAPFFCAPVERSRPQAAYLLVDHRRKDWRDSLHFPLSLCYPSRPWGEERERGRKPSFAPARRRRSSEN